MSELDTAAVGLVVVAASGGGLAVIYAHLMSLGNLGTLVDRLSRCVIGSKAAPLR